MAAGRRLQELRSGRVVVKRQSVERSWNIARYLASKGPKTTKELATEFGLSQRMVFRVMAALKRAEVPVFQRKSPGHAPLLWDIDVGILLRQFSRG